MLKDQLSRLEGAQAKKSQETVPSNEEFPGMVLSLQVRDIDPNPYQPRKHFNQSKLDELKNSIASSGLLQPPVVRKVGDRYQLIAGERRLRAVKELGHETIQVIVTELTDQQVATMALIENMQREDVRPMSTAHAVLRMNKEFGLSQTQIAEQLGVTQAKVSQYLSLTKLIEPFAKLVDSGELNQSIGRIVAGLAPEKQKLLENRINSLTAKDAQGVVNFINHVDKVRAEMDLEIRSDDSLHDKLLKYLVTNDAVDWYYGIQYWGAHDCNFSSFYVSRFSFTGINEDRRVKQFFSILEMQGREYQRNARRLEVKCSKQQELLNKFLDEYFDYKDEKTANKSEKQTERKPEKRESKEEREQRIKAVEAASPVQVLDFNTGKTKTERMLKRLQERQGDPINDRSTLCVNCQFFNPDGKTYEERCGTKYGFNIHYLSRYKLEGEPDVFICHNFSPKPEHIKSLKTDGMDIESSMFRLLLDVLRYDEYAIERLFPAVKGLNREQKVKFLIESDEKTKAYFLHVVSLVASNSLEYIMDPDGSINHLEKANIIGADDI